MKIIAKMLNLSTNGPLEDGHVECRKVMVHSKRYGDGRERWFHKEIEGSRLLSDVDENGEKRGRGGSEIKKMEWKVEDVEKTLNVVKKREEPNLITKW
jgi:hypothetical protein